MDLSHHMILRWWIQPSRHGKKCASEYRPCESKEFAHPARRKPRQTSADRKSVYLGNPKRISRSSPTRPVIPITNNAVCYLIRHWTPRAAMDLPRVETNLNPYHAPAVLCLVRMLATCVILMSRLPDDTKILARTTNAGLPEGVMIGCRVRRGPCRIPKPGRTILTTPAMEA